MLGTWWKKVLAVLGGLVAVLAAGFFAGKRVRPSTGGDVGSNQGGNTGLEGGRPTGKAGADVTAGKASEAGDAVDDGIHRVDGILERAEQRVDHLQELVESVDRSNNR